MPALTPIERAVATYCTDWTKAEADKPGVAKVNAETLSSATPPDFRFRYIDITSVNEGAIDWDAVARIRFADSPSRARRVIRKGDTMICTVRPLLKSHAYVGWAEDEPTVCSTGFAVLRCSGGLLPNFLKHLPFVEQVTRQLIAWQCGTSYPAVNERDIRQLVLPVPPHEEQAAIANILDAVDAAIERTRIAIEKAQRLKRGVLQRLLTLGIQPSTLTKTLAGQLSNRWHCERLGVYIHEGPTNGLYRPESDYGHDGTPIVRIDSFAEGLVHDLKALRRVRLPKDEVTRYALSERDILINRVNSLSHIGKSAIVPALMESTVFESNMMRLRLKPELLPEFLILFLCSERARAYWLTRAKPAVNQSSINQKDVRQLHVPVASPDEQQEIVNIAAAHTRLVDAAVMRCRVLERLKRGLMQDLLTGKMRVTADGLDHRPKSIII